MHILYLVITVEILSSLLKSTKSFVVVLKVLFLQFQGFLTYNLKTNRFVLCNYI